MTSTTTTALIPAVENWHPLDGVPAPEYIPKNWDGPHVGRRLIEGFRTLARTPMRQAAGFRPTSWPLYRQEVSEYFAALVDAENPIAAAAERNRARLAPSAVEITRMELVIGWPARYLGDQPELAIIVQVVARYRALDWPLEDIARKLRRAPPLVRRCNRLGLDTIASGLVREAIAIF